MLKQPKLIAVIIIVHLGQSIQWQHIYIVFLCVFMMVFTYSNCGLTKANSSKSLCLYKANIFYRIFDQTICVDRTDEFFSFPGVTAKFRNVLPFYFSLKPIESQIT